jgi:hypothetical protein
MSGPKCIDISPDPRVVERQESLRQCASLCTILRQRQSRLDELFHRLHQLGDPRASRSPITSEVDGIVARFVADDRGKDAVVWLKKSVHDADSNIAEAEGLIEETIVKLQVRFRSVGYECGTIAAEKERMLIEMAVLYPPDWPEADKNSIVQQLATSLSAIEEPKAPIAGLDSSSIERLVEAEAALSEMRRKFAESRRAAQDEINKVHARLVKMQIGISIVPPQSLAKFLQGSASFVSVGPDSQQEGLRIERVLAQLAALGDLESWGDIGRRVNKVAQEANPASRAIALEGLMLECSRRLKDRRQVADWRRHVDNLISTAAHVRCPSVDVIIGELEALSRSGKIQPMESYEVQLLAAMTTEEARLEREKRRRIVLTALAELGYEAVEGMEVALVDAGRVVVKKIEDNYALEVVLNRDLSLLQTEVVRKAESSVAPSAAADISRQTEWCTEHNYLREHLKRAGYDTNFRLKMQPGAIPLRTLAVETKSLSNARRCAAEKLSTGLEKMLPPESPR